MSFVIFHWVRSFYQRLPTVESSYGLAKGWKFVLDNWYLYRLNRNFLPLAKKNFWHNFQLFVLTCTYKYVHDGTKLASLVQTLTKLIFYNLKLTALWFITLVEISCTILSSTKLLFRWVWRYIRNYVHRSTRNFDLSQ